MEGPILLQLQGSGIGLSEMINAMASPPVYVPAYGVEPAGYAPYPTQYVTQGYITSPAPAPAPAPPVPAARAAQLRDPFEGFAHLYEEPVLQQPQQPPRERRDHTRERDRRDREHRDRDRDRERDRRDRDRRDYRDRDRDRERDRDRDRDRDRERDTRWRDEDRERSRDRDRDYKDRDYDRESRDSGFDEDRTGDYKVMPPNNTIMVRGLAQHITENDIRADILACNLMPKDIRLVRRKDSGASRGFAFVEFTTVHDATRWMEAKQGVLIIQDVYRATLQYSIPKEASERHAKASQDWFCIRCGAHNFKRRDSCFKCCSPRYESEAGDEGSDEVCSYPTNTLILRGLDVLSTEESVLQSIQHAGSDLPIRSVRIGRDPLTNTSRGVCYVELNSVLDSMQLYNKLVAEPPTIDNKQITISYCKLNQTPNASGSSNSSWSQQYHQPAEYTAGADIKQLAEYSASLYAHTPEDHSTYLQYYTMYYQQQAANQQTSGNQSDSVNAAAAVAQSALQAMQQKTNGGSVSATAVAAAAAVAMGANAVAAAASQVTYSSPTPAASTTTTTDTTAVTTPAVASTPTPSITAVTPTLQPDSVTGELTKYPAPDVSTYQYDDTSGYYYDPTTALYYDANSTYYYNPDSGQYLYWDSERSTYLPAPTEDGDGRKSDKKEKEKDKQDKVKVAKKIAKDMERWAKAQNKRNESAVIKLVPDPVGGPVGEGTAGSGAADAAFAVLLERRDRASLVEKQNQVFQMHLKKDAPPVLGILKKSGLVAAYGDEGSESEEEKEPQPVDQDKNDEKLVDFSKLACLLCKRQFANKDALTRHVQLSDLHKNNMDTLQKQKLEDDSEESNVNGQTYRDRAKERRQKYGQSNNPPTNKLKERYMAAREEAVAGSYEEPTKEGIGNDNIGNKLLKKMGWTDGQGLGKANQGRTKIIETERRVNSAGLGMVGSTYSVVGDTYKDCVKKMMFHRYQALDAQEKDETT